MPEVAISALTAATGITDDDVLIVNDGATTKKITAANARPYFVLTGDGVASARFGNAAEGTSPWVAVKSNTTTNAPDYGKPRLMLSYVVGGYTPTNVTTAFDVAASAVTRIDIVIYNRAADGMPGTLAASWTFTGDATGAETLTGQTEALPKSDWYWCGVHAIQLAAETAPTMPMVSAAQCIALSGADDRNMGIISTSTQTAGADLTSAQFDTSRFVSMPVVTMQVN